MSQPNVNVYQAYITGSASVTGFVGQSATFPFAGDYDDQENGIETGVASTGEEPSVDIDIQAYYPGQPLNFIGIDGYCTNNAIVAGVNVGEHL